MLISTTRRKEEKDTHNT